jgi:hypothetical protein
MYKLNYILLISHKQFWWRNMRERDNSHLRRLKHCTVRSLIKLNATVTSRLPAGTAMTHRRTVQGFPDMC